MSRPAANIARELENVALVKLYELDYGPAIGQPTGNDANIRRFVGDENGDGTGVALNGIPYDPLPLKDSGFGTLTRKAPSRPILEVFNGDGVISALLDSIGDITGSIVKRILIYPEHLDEGTDPDPLAHYEPDVYRIERVRSEDRFTIEFELSALADVEIEIPSGRASSDFCRWTYLDPETCGWVPVAGAFFDKRDILLPDDDPLDDCGLRSMSCKIRFTAIAAPLRFGGFVAIARLVT